MQYELQLIEHNVRGNIIRQRASDGYINATAMCRAAKKEWPRYRELKSTGLFFRALSMDLGLNEAQLAINNLGTLEADRKNQGTWVHPQVAIDLAQWLSPEFKVLVTRWVFEWMSGKEMPGNRNRGHIPDFVDRFHRNQKQVPAGHFSVISELFVVAYALLEREGYVLPEKGIHGKAVSPDISVGKHFSKWLHETYPDIASTHRTYTHLFSDGRTISGVKAYPNRMLGVFRDYVINTWMREHALTYFKRVDPPAIPYVQSVIQSLPSPQAYEMLTSD
ncbi:KilA-N domain-containing protein [Tepidicaulis sp.]|uniref:KilA-N domain-containing protein n=1 Tax=Tepidicaulis sp. TaxID=1920809 RepID=UPI003B595789